MATPPTPARPSRTPACQRGVPGLWRLEEGRWCGRASPNGRPVPHTPWGLSLHHSSNKENPPGGRSLRGRVSPAPGNPHDGSEVGLPGTILSFLRLACADMKSTVRNTVAARCSFGLVSSLPSAVRDDVSPSDGRCSCEVNCESFCLSDRHVFLSVCLCLSFAIIFETLSGAVPAGAWCCVPWTLVGWGAVSPRSRVWGLGVWGPGGLHHMLHA